VEESIGERIKAARRAKKLTLSNLAEKCNLSASHLSQIERDKVTPSLTTLANIARALEVNLRDLFESERDQLHIARATYRADETDAASPVESARLTNPESGWKLEVHRLTLHPAASPLEFEPYRGEVLGFVLQGRLKIGVGDEQFELETGDSIHYDANQPYRLCCSGDEPCVLIWCNSPPRQEGIEAKRQVDTRETQEVFD